MSRGVARERQVRDLLRADGFVVYRAGGSFGCADLVAMKRCHGWGTFTDDAKKPLAGTWLCQIKSDARGPYGHFPPAEREALKDEARQAGARAVLCWWPPDRKGPRWLHPGDWPA